MDRYDHALQAQWPPPDPEWERALYLAARYLSLTERHDRLGSYVIGPGGDALPAEWRWQECQAYAREQFERWLTLGPGFTAQQRHAAMRVVEHWPLEEQERFCRQWEEAHTG